MTTALKKIDTTTVHATVEIGSSELQGAVAKAEARLGQQVVVEGFRQGKVPSDVLRSHIKPEQIREEALQIAVTESLQKLSTDEKLDILDQQNFVIKDNTPEKLVYEVTLSLYPTVTLGEYKGISVSKKNVAVTEDELTKVLKDIAQSRAVNDTAPELTDEFAKSIGNFSSLDNLREMVRTGLLHEKEDREKERVRIEMLDTIVKKSQVPTPARMVELQLDSMLANFDAELHSRGLEMGPYLVHLKKTQDDLRKDWRVQAEEQVRMQLVMHAIARAEGIRIGADELQSALEEQIQQYLAGRPGSDMNELKNIDLEQVRSRLYSVLLNQKIFEFIETHAIITA